MSSRSRIAIVTARALYGVRDAGEYHRWLLARGSVKQRLVQLNIRASQVGEPPSPDTNAPPAVAYVNHGRWVADCPTPFCIGAGVLFDGSPFLCGNCLNAECGYRYRLVQWPEERGAIEEILAARLLPENANWRPGETVDDLATENEVYAA